MVREGHQAVEGEHRQRHGSERDAHGRDGVEAVRVAGGAVGVLREGPAAQERGEHAEDQRVQGDADEEELLVQEPALGLEDRIMADGVTAGQQVGGISPIPQRVAEGFDEGQRNNAEHDDHRQAGDQELPVAADERGPAGVEDAGDHRQHQHADKDGDPEERADEDREGLAVVVMGDAGEGEVPDDGEGDDADGQEFLPVGGEGVRRGSAHGRIT